MPIKSKIEIIIGNCKNTPICVYWLSSETHGKIYLEGIQQINGKRLNN